MVDRSQSGCEAPVVLTAAAVEVRRPRRVRAMLLLGAGWVSTGLALVGVVLPLVPTTPFLLLAAACFLRCSPRLHRRLLADPRFGPLVARWQSDRSVPRSAKRRACLLVVATFAISIAILSSAWARVALLALMVVLLVFLAGLRTSGAEPPPERPEPPAGPPGDR